MVPEKQDETESRFRHGACYPMALALSERIGGTIEALVADLPHGGHVVHAWAVDADGRAVDAGGPFDRETLYGEFLEGTRETRKWTGWRYESFPGREEYLARLREFCGEGFWQEYHDGCFAEEHEQAVRAVEDYVIPRYLPDLAEKPSP